MSLSREHQFGKNFCRRARKICLSGLVVGAIINFLALSPFSPLPDLPMHYYQKFALVMLSFGVALFLFDTMYRALNRTPTILED